LVDEFMANPIGHHSPDLQHLLLLFRGEPAKGKYALVCTEPYREWTLARLSGEAGKRTTLLKGHVYTSIADAERAVFRLRWKKQFGEEL
jgi:hypothetical protein